MGRCFSFSLLISKCYPGIPSCTSLELHIHGSPGTHNNAKKRLSKHFHIAFLWFWQKKKKLAGRLFFTAKCLSALLSKRKASALAVGCKWKQRRRNKAENANQKKQKQSQHKKKTKMKPQKERKERKRKVDMKKYSRKQTESLATAPVGQWNVSCKFAYHRLLSLGVK